MKRNLVTLLAAVVFVFIVVFASAVYGEVVFYESKTEGVADGKWWVGVDGAGAFAGIDTKGLAVGGLKSTIVRCKALEVNSKVIPLNLDFLLLSELHTIKSVENVDAGIGISGIPFNAKTFKAFGKLELYSTVGIGYSPDLFVGPARVFVYVEAGGKWGAAGPDITKFTNSSKGAAQFIAYVNDDISG